MANFHLHLLLGRAIAVAHHADHAAQLHHGAEGRRHDGTIRGLVRDRHVGDVTLRRDLLEDGVRQDGGAVVIVLVGVFDEAEAVHVAHVRLAVRSQQVEAAHGLLERFDYFVGNDFFFCAEHDWVSDLELDVFDFVSEHVRLLKTRTQRCSITSN